MEEQTKLGMTEDEVGKKDKLASKFFTPESNMKYTMTFSGEPEEDQDSPDGKCVTGRLLEVESPVFDKAGKKTDATEKKIIRQMVIDSLDGNPCRKLWRIKSRKMRDLFRTYAENNMLLSKKYVVEIKGELIKGNYQVVALDKAVP